MFRHNKKSKGDKFASWSRRCVFVGYPNTQNGWKLDDLESEEIFLSCDVSSGQDVSGASGVLTSYLDDEEDIGEVSMVSTGPSTSAPSSTDPSISVPSSLEVAILPEHVTTSPTSVTLVEPEMSTVSMGSTLAALCTTVASLGRGLRTKHPSILLQDYVTHSVLNGVEPRNFSEAMSDPGWCEAMSQEIRALETNKTWVMEPLPLGQKAFVAGIDFYETFAPMAKMVTVRTFLVIAAAKR
ncbi:hypothetical protein LIER_38276 [Lithospermum erythrorhizon]|uniref:Retroviral polymerase SH3-like domain-containing protein n=1 Tax=Lithospermum erythrorhizon TaxID=34254 RepID=A0AAV3PXA3_LITER